MSDYRIIPEGYDIEPIGSSIFNGEYYNGKVKEVLDGVDKTFVDKKIHVVNHGDTLKVRTIGEKVVTNLGEFQTLINSSKIDETLGGQKKLNVHYSGGTNRMEHTKNIFLKKNNSTGADLNPIETESLSSSDKKSENKVLEIFSKTCDAGKYLLEKGGKGKDSEVFLGHSTFMPGLKEMKKSNPEYLYLNPSDMISADTITFDFKNGEMVLDDNPNILEFNLDNYGYLKDFFGEEKVFEKHLKDFKEKKIDLKHLQNKINIELNLDKKLYNKYYDKFKQIDKAFIEVKKQIN